MRIVLPFLGLLSILVLGFALLAVSQDQHRRALSAPPLRSGVRTMHRIAGHGVLLAALPLAIRQNGAGFGVLLWVVSLSIAAWVVTVTLALRPEWLKPLPKALHAAETTLSLLVKALCL